MNNLHRELAPISAAAWQDLEQEVRRVFTLHVAGRRVVDVGDAQGPSLAAVGTGHLGDAETTVAGVGFRIRMAQPVVELRVPFRLSRDAVDSVERGASDADWSSATDAAKKIALAEDGAIFDGLPVAGTIGIRPYSSHEPLVMPSEPDAVPGAVARAVDVLRDAGVGGPYALLLSASAYTTLSGAVENGYPVLEHLHRIIGGDVLWAPAIDGGCVLSTRGGDYELVLGRDLSIGYQDHDVEGVGLYLQESFAFLTHTAEAGVALSPRNV